MRKEAIAFMAMAMVGLGMKVSAQGDGGRRQRSPMERPVVHDPSMADEKGVLYVFSTGRGVMQLHTSDMKTWEVDGPCLDTLPSWVYRELPSASMHVWAPDILYYRGEWHLFYCCSAFGKNTSVIGHMVSKSLDRQSKSYGWEDPGLLLRSVPHRDNWNAIDPNVIVDSAGTPWLTFGSFWGGLKLVRLTDDLSAVAEPQEWHTVCSREQRWLRDDSEAGNAAVEAPFVFRHGEYYYLFASFDYCCRGEKSTYHVVVGRSRDVRGPYEDKEGRRMDLGGGTRLVGGDGKEYVAAGHCSVHTYKGVDYIAYHSYRRDNGRPELTIKKIEWEQGWPEVR